MISRVLLADSLMLAGASAGPVLGLDTGTQLAHLGLVNDGRIIASVTHSARSHGADLPDLAAALLAGVGLRFKDLAAVAVGLGPGSFTGLRVGLSYVKGLALGAKLKAVGVPSLDAIALTAADKIHPALGLTVCPIIDARKGEVYTSLYGVTDVALERRTDDLVIALELLSERLEGKIVFAGEAKAEEACAHFRSGGGDGEVVGNAQLQLIGGFIAAIGAARVARNDVDPIFALEPRYVRAPDATVRPIALKPGEAIHGTTRRRANPTVCGT
jgi:tRNA threonylcarbamoyladenosine biosynthesis protein TsaB